ncbi:heat intolerant 4-like protein, partial [Tanacetum coccineum]
IFITPLGKMRRNITVVDIMNPAKPPVVCEFDWELDELETSHKLEELTDDQKDEFKEFIKERVREAKRAKRDVEERM